jgi:hypothetical protein
MSAKPNQPLVDHRVYNIAPRCMPQFLEIFNRMGMPVLKATLGTPIGMYTTVVGPLNQFVELVISQETMLMKTIPSLAHHLAA